VGEQVGFEFGWGDLVTLKMSFISLAPNGLSQTVNCITNLDLDQFLNPIDDEYVLCALRAETYYGLVSGAHPTIFECLFGGLVIVQIAQDNTWTSDNELAWCVVLCDFFAFWCHNSCLESWNQSARGAEEDIVRMS
jgi:hypothetical protein